MLATKERVDILDNADQLSKMILSSEVVEEYFQCLYKLRQDETAINLIKKFVKQKEKYDEVHRFGRYHPDYLQVITETRTLKREMDLNSHVAAFKQSETKVQSLLDEISVLIGKSVSDYIKVPTGDPFFDTLGGGCSSGGCGSGGSCGCS
ncbi:YlbF family regulator [Bacillus sp. Marseille-P3661]|uniref:YlbF family regulator n=1 Tax=Bacillus sp. Marseille-P3661 TaxID=1936234 RepID=UPI000C8349E4|nr:YlbF family regulator [Bacillus sp. Marseille-P3661]